MKLLILADIHSNIEALEAVLAKESFDYAIVLGDIVDYGPSPAECVQRVRSLKPIIIKGNHDAAVVEGFVCGNYGGVSIHIRQWNREVLPLADQDYLRWLPLDQSLTIGGARLYLVHGAPSEPLAKYLPPSTPDEEFQAEVDRVDADYVFLAHTHIPMVRIFGYKALVNPGSVGQPRDGDPRASYAVWDDGRVELRRIEYPIVETIRKFATTPLSQEEVDGLANILRRGG